MAYLWIGIGSALGGMARYGLAAWIADRAGGAFPWGILLVNVLGSFVIGAAFRWSGQETVRFFVMVGLCGGFTTFSSFSLEAVQLVRSGEAGKAAAYAGLSVVLCLAANATGLWMARWGRP